MGVDLALVNLSLYAATMLRPHLAFLPFAAHYPEVIPTPWQVYLIFSIEWLAVFLLLSMYDGRKNLRAVDELATLTIASMISSIASAGTLYLSFREVSRLLFISFAVLCSSACSLWRGFHRLYQRLTQSDSRRTILVVGNNPKAQTVIDELQKQTQYHLVHLDIEVNDQGDQNQLGNTTKVIEKIDAQLQAQHIDDLLLTFSHNTPLDIEVLVSRLHRLPVKVWLLPDFFKLILYKSAVEELGGVPLIDLKAPALNEYQRLIKRLFDLLVCVTLLPVFLPLMGLIALAIRLQSPGKVILSQERVGEQGRLFKMYKFRTMIAEAETLSIDIGHTTPQGDYIHKIPDDPRVTSLGRLLRRSSLDELPQLFNVLKGEMSLVGPRPELPHLVEKYALWQRQRFAVPQGITGWWQIHGRSDRPMHLHTHDDLYYVQNYSLWLDIYILFKTIGVVISGQGAF